MIANVYLEYYEREKISGKAYAEFIEKCFKHSKYFSFLTPPDLWYPKETIQASETIFKKFEPYLIEQKLVDHFPGTLPEDSPDENDMVFQLNIYRCCPQTKQLLIDSCEGLFSWTDGKPENLVFYYPDKSVFLLTIAHEGECTISCSKEIFEEFKEYGLWQVEDNEGYISEIFF